jgi:hypothetical protein
MSQLFDDLAKLDRNIANRWKTRTRDNEKHILSARDIDFILADVIRAAHTTDITEKQGTAIVLLINASIKSDDLKSAPAVDRLVYYVNLRAVLREAIQGSGRSISEFPLSPVKCVGTSAA